jgi:hypothetical protein
MVFERRCFSRRFDSSGSAIRILRRTMITAAIVKTTAAIASLCQNLSRGILVKLYLEKD